MNHRTLSSLAAAAGLLALTLAPSTARPCGGFFCNAATQSPIYQAGERVLFASHDGLVTMHIEIVYQGDPTQFGWLLPVPDAPTDISGNPLPLDQAVQISSQALFNTLQSQTDPVFNGVQGEPYPTECEPDSGGIGCGQAIAVDRASGGAFAMNENTVGPGVPPEEPPVEVVDTAKVGPYDAELIDASSSDALFDWLNDNGYLQDEAARPLLAYYVSQGYKFVGIRLQNGKDTGDLRPLAITLGENAPCVPLRLTGIAATPDMPILVWVLGPARAVPKNFLHAVVNPRAVSYPGGANYINLVSEAVDIASGRAWVTEFSGPDATIQQALAPEGAPEAALAALQQPGVETIADVEQAYSSSGMPFNLDYQTVRAEEETGGAGIEDVERYRQRLIDEVVRPMIAVKGLFSQSTTLTRFYTTLDPDEMTRDPIFAFNPELPEVSNQHTLTIREFVSDDCESTSFIGTWDDGSMYTFDQFGGGISGWVVPDEPALEVVEVLDETGPPRRIALSEVEEVDTLLDSAAVGQPSLPAQADPAAPEDTKVQFPNPPDGWTDDGCQAQRGVSAAMPLVLALLALLVFRARRRRPIS